MPRAGSLLLALAAILLADQYAYAYMDPGDYDERMNDLEYGEEFRGHNDIPQDVDKRSSLIYVFRRACIRRGGNCDHRPGDCCHSSSCRCNLWGSNCRCQRMGLFQKWG